MNLIYEDIEKLEQLPQRDNRRNVWEDGRDCNGMNYTRLKRWLRSRVGTPWNQTVSDFVRLDWVPARFRTLKELKRFVETNTFVKDNNVVWFYDEYSYISEKEIDKEACETFYVHPVSRLLAHKPKTKYVRKSTRDWLIILGPYNQLLKLHGIWYHIWAEDVNNHHLLIHYRHNEPLIENKHLLPYQRPKFYKVQLDSRTLRHYKLKNDHNMPVYNKCKICGAENCWLHAN